MSHIITADVSGKGRYKRDKGGWDYERHFIIGGLNGDPSQRYYEASVCPGLPQYDDPHPTIGGLYVRSIDVMPEKDSPSMALVAIGYNFGSAFKVYLEWGATVARIQTTLDANGNQMVVFPPGYLNGSYLVGPGTETYNGLGQFGTSLLGNNDSPAQPAQFDVEIPVAYAILKRSEYRPFDLDVTAFIKHVNNAAMQIGTRQFDRGTVLCSNIRAILPEKSDMYEVSYEFQIKPDGWYGTWAYKDPDTGAPMAGCNYDDFSIVDFQLYPLADMGQLRLSTGLEI